MLRWRSGAVVETVATGGMRPDQGRDTEREWDGRAVCGVLMALAGGLAAGDHR